MKGYNRSSFFNDLNAGISVGILALPLAMAFGIASGVTPEQGLYTAIIAGFIISIFGWDQSFLTVYPAAFNRRLYSASPIFS